MADTYDTMQENLCVIDSLTGAAACKTEAALTGGAPVPQYFCVIDSFTGAAAGETEAALTGGAPVPQLPDAGRRNSRHVPLPDRQDL